MGTVTEPRRTYWITAQEALGPSLTNNSVKLLMLFHENSHEQQDSRAVSATTYLIGNKPKRCIVVYGNQMFTFGHRFQLFLLFGDNSDQQTHQQHQKMQ